MYSIFMAVALLVAGVAMTGCKNSEKNEPEQPKQVKTYKMSIQVSKGTDDPVNGPRRVLGLDGSTLNATWAAGEQVRVYNETEDEYLDGYLTPSEPGGASTTLTGTLTGSVNAGDKVRLEFLSPSYSSQAGTLAYISANCDYAIAEHIEVESAENGIISTDGTATFVNQQAVVRFRLIHKGDNPLNVTEFVITAGSNTYTITPASATNVLYVAIPGYIGGMTFTATDGTNNYTHTKAVADLYNGRYYTTEIDMDLVPVILGPYSVSGTTTVNFSAGNLQYNSDNQVWQFAAHQYDFVGKAAGNNAITSGGIADNNGIVDLFGWVGASSSWVTGSTKQYGISSSKTQTDYGNVVNDNLKRDWGYTMGSGWRTLTIAEWQYIFNTRTTGKTVNGTNDARYTQARINTDGTPVPGIILFPDNYAGGTPTGVTWGAINTASDWASATTCTSAGWEALEKAACVFLPAASYRSGTYVDDTDTYGYYWSSSPYMHESYASNVYIYSNFVNTAAYNLRYIGQSVRLVQNAD